MPYINSAPLGLDDIILVNSMAFKNENLQPAEGDPLDAINGDMEDANMDAFLNLHTFEDEDMSSDSAKRKRLEEGEEASSHGPS